MYNSNYIRSMSKIFRHLWVIVIFRFVVCWIWFVLIQISCHLYEIFRINRTHVLGLALSVGFNNTKVVSFRQKFVWNFNECIFDKKNKHFRGSPPLPLLIETLHQPHRKYNFPDFLNLKIVEIRNSVFATSSDFLILISFHLITFLKCVIRV